VGTLWQIAWRNLWRGWRRSAIVTSSITAGLCASLLLVSWSHGWLQQIADTAVATRLAPLAVHAQGYQADPDPALSLLDGGRALVTAVERFPGAHAAPRVLGDGLAQSARQSARVSLIGVDPEREARVSLVPRSLQAGHMPEAQPPGAARRLPEVTLGVRLAEKLHVKLGDKLVARTGGESGLAAFRVAGLFATGAASFDESALFVRIEDAQRLLGLGDRVSEVAVALDDRAALPRLIAFAREELPRAQPEQALEILTWQEREPRLAALIDLMANTAWVAYATVFAGMAFGIANALLMSVYERIREFGVLRSLGLSASSLVWLVLFESFMLTVSGALLGIGLALAAVAVLGRTGIDLSRYAEGLARLGAGSTVYPTLAPADLVSPLGLALLTAFLAAIWPAWKAARLRPAEALRHV
jgi:ABC-type lipoprotein release transport system permease subunit